jgi:hypothetical protein
VPKSPNFFEISITFVGVTNDVIFKIEFTPKFPKFTHFKFYLIAFCGVINCSTNDVIFNAYMFLIFYQKNLFLSSYRRMCQYRRNFFSKNFRRYWPLYINKCYLSSKPTYLTSNINKKHKKSVIIQVEFLFLQDFERTKKKKQFSLLCFF